MNQSEINTALDNAYAELPAIGNVVDKKSKVLIMAAITDLYLAIKISEAHTPEKAPELDFHEGSDIQQLVAVRKVKNILENFNKVFETELPKPVEEHLAKAHGSLQLFVSEKEEKQVKFKESEKEYEEPVEEVKADELETFSSVEQPKLEELAVNDIPATENEVPVTEEPIQ